MPTGAQKATKAEIVAST